MKSPMRLFAAKTNRQNINEWLPLWMHAEDTAGMMECLWDHWLPESIRRHICDEESERSMRRSCRFLGYLHDLGKCTALFQSRILTALPDIQIALEASGVRVLPLNSFLDAGKTPHALAGECILLEMGCLSGFAAVVGSHHGRPQEAYLDATDSMAGYAKNYRGLQESAWTSAWKQWVQTALVDCGWESLSDLPAIPVTAQILLSALLIMADWLASNPNYFPLISVEDSGDHACYPERVRQAWQRVHLPDFWMADGWGMDAGRFGERFGFYPNDVQSAVLQVTSEIQRPGILIMEAQMGVGKTEAALAAAEIFAQKTGAGGLFFGLPTQATANGLFPRLANWAEQQSETARLSIRLAHGMAELNEDYQRLFLGSANIERDEDAGLIVHNWFQGRKQALLSNFVIGTVDQLLMAALKQKHVMLRHLGLAGKVVVIDECHAYDAYMSHYLDGALSWLGAYHVPVIVLSATLPSARRVALVEAYLNISRHDPRKTEFQVWKTTASYPLLTWTDGETVKQQVVSSDSDKRSVAVQWITDDERVGILSDQLSDGGCAVVVVNTVKRAQLLYEQVRAAMSQFEVVLFHAQFLMPDRAELEKMLLKKLGKDSDRSVRDHLIVIGTQVLEQSLDIDADLLITDLCPMDLLLQRIGRLHRHRAHDEIRPDALKTAHCYVTSGPDDALEPGAEGIYGPWLLVQTKRLLPDAVVLPDSIPQLVQRTYGEVQPNEPDAEYLKKLKEEHDTVQKKAQRKADVYRLSLPVDSAAEPMFNRIDGLLDNLDIYFNDIRAQAAVRDGVGSIEALVLMRHGDDIGYLPWQHDGQIVPTDRVPSDEECCRIMRQRIKLPSRFCIPYRADETIRELETVTLQYFSEWRYAPKLNEEVVLLLDERLEAHLCGCRITYTKESGLMYEVENNV